MKEGEIIFVSLPEEHPQSESAKDESNNWTGDSHDLLSASTLSFLPPARILVYACVLMSFSVVWSLLDLRCIPSGAGGQLSVYIPPEAKPGQRMEAVAPDGSTFAFVVSKGSGC